MGEVDFTNLDQPLFDGADAVKGDLVDYLRSVRGPVVGALRDRPLSVIRVRPGQAPFMQKNLPKYAPGWIVSSSMWAEASHREVTYALCNDERTLMWFANQRAVEYHVTLFRIDAPSGPTHLVMDLDPPEGGDFSSVVAAARLVRQTLSDLGLDSVVKTSGSKGAHIFVPVNPVSFEDAAAATRAVAARAERLDPALATTAFIREDRGGKVFLDSTRAGGATVAAAYSPRIRPGVTVSYPVAWDALGEVTPRDFTIRTVPGLRDDRDPWTDLMPAPQDVPADLIAEGRQIPIARVAAMHEGKRRARARRDTG
jgi:bifunctional non-homologous end joining protein LigD